MLLVTLPALLVTVTAKRAPSSVKVVGGVVYERFVAPVIFVPFFVHWQWRTGVPVAEKLNVALCPRFTVV